MDIGAYAGLFLAAFGAATLLPMQSEAVLVGLLLTERFPAALLLLIASLGNVLGSTVNWWLGRHISRWGNRRWFPLKEKDLKRVEHHYHRYGRWSLLLSWVPVIGDPLTLLAGVLREPFWSFVLIVTVAKTARYLVLTAFTLGWLA
ncbi:YqaA family protein [Pseudomonas tohonis]|uniref:YqaA family protein n=1 Tax=Pseudomonas sp. zfem005 TaxID=3078200 RepID=UPI000396D46A|nr:YqaA family protein [Pseudomonas sp. zfem005]EQM72060.1 hypothetical protein L682_00135 [Pseudomonas alcaligenes OT 69]MDN4145950.1 YqaA family protein [Pseudomonas tohonis]MDU9415283.1 YqaA family protein [Pseudomonas sp. zfem005]